MINVDGVILAAGRSSRMGSLNKVEARLAGRSLLSIVNEKIAPQVEALVINGDPAICGEDAVADRVEGFKGPLAGLYSAMCSDKLSPAEYLMMVPCDGPFIPATLVTELYASITKVDADIACVRYRGVAQPTFSLWHKRLLANIENALLVEQLGGFKPLLDKLSSVYVDWPEQPINPFFNINTPEQLKEAEQFV